MRVSGTIRSNFGEALRQAALLGQGISMHPIYMVDKDIEEKRLRIVLPAYSPTGLDIYVVFPSRINMPVRVRIFLEFLRNRFETSSGFQASGPA